MVHPTPDFNLPLTSAFVSNCPSPLSMNSPYGPSSDGVSSPGAQSWTTDVSSDSDKPKLSSALTSVPLRIPGGINNTLHPNTVADIFSKVKPLVSPIKQRTPRACDKCRERKTKCSGHPVCNRCTSRGLSCVYSNREQGARRSSRPTSLSPLPEPPHFGEKPLHLQRLHGNLGIARPTPAARSTMGIVHTSAFVSEPLALDGPDYSDAESIHFPFPENQVLRQYQLPNVPSTFPDPSWGTPRKLDPIMQSDCRFALSGYDIPLKEQPLQADPGAYPLSLHSPFPEEVFVQDQQPFVYLCDSGPHPDPFTIVETTHELASNHARDDTNHLHFHALPHPSVFHVEDFPLHESSSTIPPETYNGEGIYRGLQVPVYPGGYFC
ncbi:hypothetical protein CPB83DRAFT_857055 [Crepidotus variabilis]|uniref:Zn(2)-C6 fungal-type domain-containing protein n=1 Tax=Crepidotus variabilis TaxID=179855 RepID=A0A9P6JNW5_9AGAR|nr:hypothetical protein CPB83DRAFT_857055 [Crepidotus variabilis]